MELDLRKKKWLLFCVYDEYRKYIASYLHTWNAKISWTFFLNRFVPNAPFIYSLKTSENRKVFWCFQRVGKGSIGNKCVNTTITDIHLTHFRSIFIFIHHGSTSPILGQWCFFTSIILMFSRSSRPEVFCKKVFLKIFQNSQENTCVGVSFLIKLQSWGNLKKSLRNRSFLTNFVKLLRIPSFN